MLDQSFSAHNFRIILQVQNRKGIYLEEKKKFNEDVFLESRSESDKILSLNKKIKDEKVRLLLEAKREHKKFDYDAFNRFRESFSEQKLEIAEKREIILERILENLAAKTNNISHKVLINQGKIKFKKQLYVAESKPEDFFVLKQVQYNLKKTFKVKQASRTLIINQIVSLLNDKFPKIILRTDIKEFYESISHRLLLDKIRENNILSYPSNKVIKDVLNCYWNLLVASGEKNNDEERIGIPRGIGISAYLAEVFMRDFDSLVKSLPNVTYYARYVDDIIIMLDLQQKSGHSVKLR